jgi:hypothetical protein
MVGPFSDGNFYCTAKEYGYCDRRSGTCFCNIGYDGIDCSRCTNTHYRVGNLCYPKQLCPNDCNGAGVCNFNNGTCSCFPHRTGPTCEDLVCKVLDPRCESCTVYECLRCAEGYYLTGASVDLNTSAICSSCYDFDPRCGGCTKEDGCTMCADPLLTSARRSGYRAFDLKLPIEEETRELSITLPLGTKSAESFSEAENFVVVGSKDSTPLNANTRNCSQGEDGTDVWHCSNFPASHKVCGHYGVFRWKYPNYRVPESYGYLPLTVMRSGGGYGAVRITYHIEHITTTDSDVSATAQYTTSQELSFDAGVVETTFRINILQDNIIEDDEVFQLVLEYPIGGGSLGPQYRANVTIVDDDINALSPSETSLSSDEVTVRAGESFALTIEAVSAATGDRMTSGGQSFYAVVENNASEILRLAARFTCDVDDNDDGSYAVRCPGIQAKSDYQLRVWYQFSGGLLGQYYTDAFFESLDFERVDRSIDFNWGNGRLSSSGSDYISIRWIGAIKAPQNQFYFIHLNADDRARMWIDGVLILDHWLERGTYLDYPRKIYLDADHYHEVVIDYLEVSGEAFCHLLWGESPLNMTVISEEYLYSLYEINGSPANVTVKSSFTSPIQSECSGDGLIQATSLQPSYFSLCPRDQFGNLRDDDDLFFLMDQDFQAYLRYLPDDPLSIQYDGLGSEYIQPDLIFNPSSSCFDGFYTAQRAGAYLLEVSYGQRHSNETVHVIGSPFYVTVEPSDVSGPYSDIFF